ncbi:MAG: hypothetical protein R3F18_02345 [Lysobacterales bacterium]
MAISSTLRADLVRPGLLYAATELGVYISMTATTGTASQMNLPRHSVRIWWCTIAIWSSPPTAAASGF